MLDNKYISYYSQYFKEQIPEDKQVLILVDHQQDLPCEFDPAKVIHIEHVTQSILDQYDVLIDMINHPFRSDDETKCSLINHHAIKKICFGINYGATSDQSNISFKGIHSDITVTHVTTPFHIMYKYHHAFKEFVNLTDAYSDDLHPSIHAQDFITHFPKPSELDHKNTQGKVLLIGGSQGMAGAMILNLIGATTVGTSYISSLLSEQIYPIVATNMINTVYHFDHERPKVIDLIKHVKAIGFGSGATNNPRKQELLDLIIQNSEVPMVFDADALRLLANNTYLLRFAKAPIILTPHLGEFSALSGYTIEQIEEDPIRYGREFVSLNNVILVLKGPHTIVFHTDGSYYINDSGNAGLARAGSGDVLTGMITGLLNRMSPYDSACYGVWLHGHLADLECEEIDERLFSFSEYPTLMNRFLRDQSKR